MFIKEIGNLIKEFEWNKLDVIVHGANCLVGVMGAGIAKQIAEKYPEALKADIDVDLPKGSGRLGKFSYCVVKNETTGNNQLIINAYTQESVRSKSNPIPFSIEALDNVMKEIYSSDIMNILKTNKKINIGLPHIGAGLGGGDLNEIESVIKKHAELNKNKFNTFFVEYTNDLIPSFKIEGNEYLSNFKIFSNPIVFEGREYNSVERAYMAAKSDDTKWKDMCSFGYKNNEQGQMKKDSKTVNLIDNWDNLKSKYMYIFVKEKFQKNEDLKQKLLSTGNAIIEEGNYHNDVYFGVCLKTNKGQNMLGRILMKVRSEIVEEIKQENKIVKKQKI